MNRLKLFCLCVFLGGAGCTNPPYRGKDVVGADEFVMDSYKIREGKWSILQMEGKSTTAFSPELLQEYKDVIQEGDRLQVILYHPTRADVVAIVQSIGETVGFEVIGGNILLPDLEPIRVEGLTIEEARQVIRERYREQIKYMEVFLNYKVRNERQVELAGLVQTPSVPADGKMRLFELLSIAKAHAQANFFKSYVVRNGALLPVDLYKLIKEGDMSQNIVMRGGDKVYIADAAAARVMVFGEVGQQRAVDMPNGYMSLKEALAEARGMTESGDKAYVQVIRGNILNPKIYTLHWQHVSRLPGDSMLLMPGDIVYVAATPIAEWNRFVSQILPTLIGFDLIANGLKNISVSTP